MSVDRSAIRAAAIAENNEAWRLLEKTDRTPEEDTALVEAAQKSLDLWMRVGTPVNEQRGVWMIARAYVDIGIVEPALQFAERTLELTEMHRDALKDFDLAFAEEIAARAYALCGDRERAAAHRSAAERLGRAIANEPDRREFFRQFELGPWPRGG